MACRAEDASSLVAKVMKPKPRDLPVSRSMIILAGRKLKMTGFSTYAYHSHLFYMTITFNENFLLPKQSNHSIKPYIKGLIAFLVLQVSQLSDFGPALYFKRF